MNGFSRRGFLKRTFGLLVLSTAEPVRLFGRLHPVALRSLDRKTSLGTYRLRVTDYPTQEILGIRYGLTEVGSSMAVPLQAELETPSGTRTRSMTVVK